VTKRRWYLYAISVCGLLAAGLLTPVACSFHPERPDLPVDLPEAFSRTGDEAAPNEWWRAFEDPHLSALIDTGLRGNLSLRSTWDRLEQARATARKSGASQYPSLELSAGASRTVTKTEGADRSYANSFSLGALASYELDLWGRVRSTKEAAELDVLASEADLHTAAMTLTSEITSAWFSLVEQREELRLLDQQIGTNEDYLEIITAKYRSGQGSAVDVLQQRQLLESSKADRVLVESRIAALEHSLAVLTGQMPGRFLAPGDSSLPNVPPLPDTGVPTEWIQTRPDIQAAFLEVEAADNRYAAAIADQFPKISISANAQTTTAEVGDLFSNWLASLAANLVEPILDGGVKRAEVQRTRAVLSERLNAYGDAVLSAIKEVEDALVQEAKQAEYVESLKKQLSLSEMATAQSLESYTSSGADFTRYLTTLLSHQRLQRTHIQAVLQRLSYRVSLYRALGGRWELPNPVPEGKQENDADTGSATK